MEPLVAPLDREQRFRDLYDTAYVDLLRFVRRRIDPSHAEDVVGDVMLVAWRRLDDVPSDLSSARAWLFGVAHKTLQNTRRREGKQEAIAVRLADVQRTSPEKAVPGSELSTHRIDIATAWPKLSDLHQEALALSALDGLSAPEAGAVLGISPTAFRLRLSRARRSLKRHLSSTPADTATERPPNRSMSERSTP